MLRPILFRLDPERAHALATRTLAPLQRSRRPLPKQADALRARVNGIGFPAPLGVAAGFDKEAHLYNALLRLGFGHVEVGTVTPRPQPGNPRPRIRRLPDALGLVNAMGFPGPGKDVIADRLAAVAPLGPIGVNVGPNKGTAADDVPDAIATAAAHLAAAAAYVAINVSSPNTPGLRDLQSPDGVGSLVGTTLAAMDDAGAQRPVWVKLHPDAPDGELVDVARAAVDAGASAIIAVNTTTRLPDGVEGPGGLSGAPLRKRAEEVIRSLHHGLGRDTPIVGVGGILNGADAYGHLRAGASLVQAYTGFIYRGPGFATQVHRELLELMDRDGVASIAELGDLA